MNIDATWLAEVIRSSDDAIVTKTREGIVVSWNPAAEELFGYTAEEMIGQPITTIFPPDRLAEEPEFLGRLARGERIEHYETVRVRKDGRRINVAVTLSPVRDAEGRVIGAAQIARDITERKRTERLAEERPRWLEGMLRTLSEGVVAVDHASRISFMNQVAEKLTGWRQEDAGGRPIDSVIWLVEEASRRRMEDPILQALSLGQQATVRHRALLISRDGLEYLVEATAAVIRDEGGGLFGAIMVLHDLTELRRSGHARDRLAAIVDSSDDAIVSKTLDGLVMTWNPGAERLFGYAAAEMVGRPITVIFPPDRLAEEAEFLGRLARGERIEHYETVRIRKDGRAVEVSVTLSPILDASGRIAGVSKIARDISERKRAERERVQLLQREQAALQDSVMANQVKDEFLATVSHELRTPVNAILGWAQLLATGKLDPNEVARGTKVIIRNARLQTELIDQLLDSSGIVLGKVALDVRPVDFTEVVQAAIESIRPSATVKDLHLDAWIHTAPVMIMGDSARLQQVAWNLMTNALKFTPAGGRVGVRLEREGTVTRFVVMDTGVGIAPEVLPSIFDRFRQADGSIKRRHGGLGLGLAIVRQLVELHGGSVWAESEGVGCGARFTVELPLLRDRAHGVPAIVPDRRMTPTVPVDLAGIRVLVVEDDRDARALVGRLLTMAGASVCEADSAPAAMKAAQDSVFDVMVADIGMPDMDGYELMTTLREQGMPVIGIALTAFGSEEDRERALEAGFRGHLRKPVVGEELLYTIAEATHRQRAAMPPQRPAVERGP